MARLGPTMRELRMNSDGEPRLFTMGIKPDGTLRVVTLAADTTHWPRDKDGDGRP